MINRVFLVEDSAGVHPRPEWMPRLVGLVLVVAGVAIRQPLTNPDDRRYRESTIVLSALAEILSLPSNRESAFVLTKAPAAKEPNETHHIVTLLLLFPAPWRDVVKPPQPWNAQCP